MSSKVSSNSSNETFKPDLFKGKVIFCTGGRSGICYSIVQSLMSLGADACIVGRDAKGLQESAERLQQQTGRKCLAAAADVRDPKSLSEAVRKTEERFGRIDHVICGAAGNFLAPISNLSENAFRTVVEIDLLGTYNTIRATLPLVRQSRGSYIHISATLHYRGTPYQAHVSAAKAGVDALSRALAAEEGPRGVRSNVIAPGPIAGTEGMDRLLPKGKKVDTEIPLQRQGSTTDIANAAIFLLSPAAAYITAATLVVDGGHWHTASQIMSYPEGVLDPESVKKSIRSRL
ncbi:peroxisomal 2,4-dienoyl-CoA reductase [Tremella mesenterica]|uniref:2,4-dienoyl-CoA reductase [(3E)-enoyl-CoA-producing] n=1 Tax=Tremella mesenterica TaxID=5217 RepID=A0A4V1M3I5_TREME|nr:uncharacterized protein TREMEDRAFT_70655 [Tremella mesenterica DSM 1558]EIW72222.1 hypothetical protein TREMEDRAFT_70655 [Tremella mesenterica DSM 1558]RXK36987.1 peroxisomal 2,4-dienoyl-CoA reductase [Tremella mesenterica]